MKTRGAPKLHNITVEKKTLGKMFLLEVFLNNTQNTVQKKKLSHCGRIIKERKSLTVFLIQGDTKKGSGFIARLGFKINVILI